MYLSHSLFFHDALLAESWAESMSWSLWCVYNCGVVLLANVLHKVHFRAAEVNTEHKGEMTPSTTMGICFKQRLTLKRRSYTEMPHTLPHNAQECASDRRDALNATVWIHNLDVFIMTSFWYISTLPVFRGIPDECIHIDFFIL